VIIGLDDVAMRGLGKPMAHCSPEFGKVIAYLKRKGTAAIGVDLMIPEPLGALPDLNAGALGAVVAEEPHNVVLPALEVDGRLINPPRLWLVPPEKPALVNLTEDNDHFLRRQQLSMAVEGRGYPQFALALIAAATSREIDDMNGLHVGGRRVPLDDEGLLRINYVGPPGTFRVIPFGVVLRAAEGGPAPDVDLGGTIAILGVTARSQQDEHATPYSNTAFLYRSTAVSGLMSGPELHANIVATLADGAFIHTPHWLTSLPMMMVLGSILGMIFARLNLEAGAIFAICHHFVWKLTCIWAFAHASIRLEMLGMLLLGALTYAVTFAMRWRRLRRTFGVMKGEAIAKALDAVGPWFSPRGQDYEVTVLFSDIRSFTAYSERRSPQQVVGLLNAYFAAIVPKVIEQGGTVDKYMGDGVMVLFGTPGRVEDHAVRAVRAAVAMVHTVHELARLWRAHDFAEMRIGVGVHTGRAVVGTIGSPRRMDFTAVGDTVNLASRIEAMNKELGTQILISDATQSLLDPAERVRLGCDATPLATKVRGKLGAVSVYRIRMPGDPAEVHVAGAASET
jgi:adenylate cyclase